MAPSSCIALWTSQHGHQAACEVLATVRSTAAYKSHAAARPHAVCFFSKCWMDTRYVDVLAGGCSGDRRMDLTEGWLVSCRATSSTMISNENMYSVPYCATVRYHCTAHPCQTAWHAGCVFLSTDQPQSHKHCHSLLHMGTLQLSTTCCNARLSSPSARAFTRRPDQTTANECDNPCQCLQPWRIIWRCCLRMPTSHSGIENEYR